ncbi:DUF2478 domain-containing protein [Tabrizicola thermarum]|jgi:nucleoside-triphosphatase THEP1|uniref:DUF2478 domain-containing protein n=1 Tax=Tabrizicola thermarum TaxID=2670345 RepID=UPI000FFB3AA0|nr:DUF2478 domain-containing protein [Tabrizicola thermarum]
MQLAFTMAPGRGDTDRLLARLADDLTTRGLRLCGTVQINTARATAAHCDMDVRVLPDGPVLRISQNLGTRSRGCRLNPEALEAAVGLVAARLQGGADLVLINKFGKHEAEGRGFRDVIAMALDRDIPVLVGLNRLNQTAFETFAGGCAVSLPPERKAIGKWIEGVVHTPFCLLDC